MFSALQDAARQYPLRLTTCDQEDSLTSATDNSGACLQTELPLVCLSVPDVFEARSNALAYRAMLYITEHANTEPPMLGDVST